MAVRPTVSILIVTYNSAPVLRNCLEALPISDDIEIVVVDNNSSDGSSAIVEEIAPGAKKLQMGWNSGFAVAVNAAAEIARGKYFLLLNPDAVITGEALRNLIKFVEGDISVGIASPLVTDGAGEFSTIAAGYRPSIYRMFTHASGLSRFGSKLPILRGHYLLDSQVDVGQVLDVSWVSGGCMLVRAETWRRHDGLSTRWFMYAEDVDFCLRVGESGERVVLHGPTAAIHLIGKGSSATDGRTSGVWIANLFDLYQRRYSPSVLEARIWRFVVATGFRGRIFVYRLKSLRITNRLASTKNISRFRSFLVALQTAPIVAVQPDEPTAKGKKLE